MAPTPLFIGQTPLSRKGEQCMINFLPSDQNGTYPQQDTSCQGKVSCPKIKKKEREEGRTKGALLTMPNIQNIRKVTTLKNKPFRSCRHSSLGGKCTIRLRATTCRPKIINPHMRGEHLKPQVEKHVAYKKPNN